jgi:hypothetical protein
MAALLAPFRNETGMLAVGAQVAAGAAVYAMVLVGVNFLGLRDSLLRRLGRSDSDVTGLAVGEGSAGHLAEAQLR